MHRIQHKTRLTAFAAVAALALAACGGGGGSSSSGGAYGAPANTSTSPAMSTDTGLSAAKVGGVGTVLGTAQGFTLYHLTTEKNGKIQCTGSCAKTWPPVLITGGNIPAAAASSLPGKVSTVKRPDGGVQVTYDGMALYTYSGDTAAGEANGQGVQGVWFAVTPAGSEDGTTTGSGGGGYGSGGGNGGGGGGYGSGGGGYGSGGGNG